MGFRKTKRFPGVYYRESTRRRLEGRPDRCFYALTKVHGKLKYNKIGWASEGINAQYAAQKRTELLVSIRKTTQTEDPPADCTLQEAAGKYLLWAPSNKRSARDDEARYRLHLAPFFGDRKLSEISPLELEGFKDHLVQKRLAGATIKHCLGLLRQIYNKALVWDLYSGPNPIRKIAMPKTDNRRVRFLSEDEAAILLAELGGVSCTLRDMACFSLYTGLRAGEMFNLTWQDVNLKTATITVKDPKNHESRTAFLNERLKKLLLHRRPANFIPSDLVFPDRNGNRMKEVSKAFSGAIKRLGFNENVPDPRDRVVFHSLRHTFASWLAIRGTPLLTIKELMGHKSIEMTMRYAHLIPDVKREAIARLPDLD